MADPALPKRAVDLANKRWGRLDSVIVNHGTLDPVKKVAETSAEEWKKGFEINVFSAVGLVWDTIGFFSVCFRFLTLSIDPSCPAFPSRIKGSHCSYLFRSRHLRLSRLGLLWCG